MVRDPGRYARLVDRRLLAWLAAILVLLALSCQSDPPQSTRTTTPIPATPTQGAAATTVATTASTPSPTATAAPIPARSPTATAAPTPAPSPTATATLTSEPAPPAVSVVGPLLVFSERLAPPGAAAGGQGDTRRVYVYDLGLGVYWAALDYEETDRSSVQPAGPGLIAWSDGQVRRVGLGGQTEATLLEGRTIGSVRVSPDGAKVALMLEGPPTVLVLDIASGEELLRATSAGSLLAPLREATSEPGPVLGSWSHDSAGLGVVWGERTALLSIAGDLRLLPVDWHVSPHLRYALRLGESAETACLNRHDCRETWKSFDAIDIVTANVLWTVTGAEGAGLTWYSGDHDDRWWRPTGPGWSGEPRFVAFRDMAGGPRMLDAASGETYPVQFYRNSVPREARGLLEGGAWSNCRGGDGRGRSYPCQVWYDERVVWEGAGGWTRYLGFVESAAGLALHGVRTIEVGPEPPAGEPPAREAMVGPLLLYAVWGGPAYADEGAGLDIFSTSDVEAVATWRVMAYDAGTGRSWPAHEDRYHFSWWGSSWGDWDDQVQGARDGLVTGGPGGMRHIAPGGQAERLLTEHWPAEFRVSPDGRRVAARFHGGGRGPDGRYNPARTVVFDLRSGEEILRVVHDEIPTAVGLRSAGSAWTVWGQAWTSDSSALVLDVVDDPMGHGGPAVGVIARLDGAIHRLPCPGNPYSESGRCDAPDGRHVVRGRQTESGPYTESNWRSIDIIAVESGDILRSVASPVRLGDWDWEWASPDHFAWSDALLPRVYPSEFAARTRAGKHADVSVLNIRTGETAMLDIQEYLARFHPPPRAITDCPENPGHPCRILLDGEVVGEGRWPTIIGFAELD